MKGYLLDTCALSEASKPRPDSGYLGWLDEVDETLLYTSCLVLGEIQKGIELCSDKAKHTQYAAVLIEIIEGFAGRISMVDVQTALTWGDLIAASQQTGKKPPAIDALIAAQCITLDLTLVTRNIKDFNGFSGLNIHCPWSTTK